MKPERLGEKVKVPDTKENLMKCICGRCPSYNECMKEKMDGLFCARGKTDCALTRAGCICGECALYTEYQLSGGYFCDTAAA